MAFCPECGGEMGTTDTVCPHCGYDFPDPGPTRERRVGIAYSTLADVALIIGSVAAALGCFVVAAWTVFALTHGQWLNGLLLGPLAFFLQLAQLVVFLRIQDLSQD